MVVLVVAKFAWFVLAVCFSTGYEMSLIPSLDSRCVIEDGGEWNSGRLRCG